MDECLKVYAERSEASTVTQLRSSFVVILVPVEQEILRFAQDKVID